MKMSESFVTYGQGVRARGALGFFKSGRISIDQLYLFSYNFTNLKPYSIYVSIFVVQFYIRFYFIYLHLSQNIIIYWINFNFKLFYFL